MKHVAPLALINSWKQSFQECSGFEVKFLDIANPTSSKKLPCLKKCRLNKLQCAITPCEIGNNGKFHIYPCPIKQRIVFIPLYYNNKLARLLFIKIKDNKTQLKKSFSEISNHIYEFTNALSHLDLPITHLDFSPSGLTHSQEILKRSILYIQNHYYQSSLTLKEVAQENNIGYHYLSHLLKKYAKENFKDYLTRIRLEKSIRLLKNLKLSIAQIASATGYQDPAYFSRVFKKKLKISPTHFRQKHCISKKNANSFFDYLKNKKDLM